MYHHDNGIVMSNPEPHLFHGGTAQTENSTVLILNQPMEKPTLAP